MPCWRAGRSPGPSASSVFPLSPSTAGSVVEWHGHARLGKGPVVCREVSTGFGGRAFKHGFNAAAFSIGFALHQLCGAAQRNSVPGPGMLNAGFSLSRRFLFGDAEGFDSESWRRTRSTMFNTGGEHAVRLAHGPAYRGITLFWAIEVLGGAEILRGRAGTNSLAAPSAAQESAL
jgi:hypothetical protein